MAAIGVVVLAGALVGFALVVGDSGPSEVGASAPGAASVEPTAAPHDTGLERHHHHDHGPHNHDQSPGDRQR